MRAPRASQGGGRGSRRALALAGGYLLLVFVVATLNFAIPRLMPGDPTVLLLGEDAARVLPEEVEEAFERFGLDRPLPEQYGRYLANLAQGDLGYSYRNRQPISELLARRLPWTGLLVGTSLVASSVLGIAAGTFSAWRRRRRGGNSALAGFVVLDSLPSFWVGLLLLIGFGAQLRWLPTFGAVTVGDRARGLAWFADVAHHLVLPATTLTLATVGMVFLITRAAMLDVTHEDFVVVARAKGLRERRIATRHGLPAASVPIATVLLLRLGSMLGGVTVIETVFSYPGVGRMMYEGALGRDYPVLQGGLLVLSLFVILANFLADVLAPRLDPRARSLVTA